MTTIEVLFTPAEFAALAQRDLSQTVCVVFDVLRATSTITMALGNGAAAIIPVAEIAEALAIRAQQPEVILAGERNGLRICADQAGGTDFDLGNSPREFTPDKVRGKTVVLTTTNGTRALRACAPARQVLIGSFLNLRATGGWITTAKAENLLLVCAGTVDQAAYEDMLGAGALCDLVWPNYCSGQVADSAEIARQIYRVMQRDLPSALQHSRNGRRLMTLPELREDVAVCVQRDLHRFVAGLDQDGAVKILPGSASSR
ncbi:MAG: 2-phosphosulfolactate phosphatase [Limisphaerales bacterium]